MVRGWYGGTGSTAAMVVAAARADDTAGEPGAAGVRCNDVDMLLWRGGWVPLLLPAGAAWRNDSDCAMRC